MKLRLAVLELVQLREKTLLNCASCHEAGKTAIIIEVIQLFLGKLSGIRFLLGYDYTDTHY
jgi:hypothetical protein